MWKFCLTWKKITAKRAYRSLNCMCWCQKTAIALPANSLNHLPNPCAPLSFDLVDFIATLSLPYPTLRANDQCTVCAQPPGIWGTVFFRPMWITAATFHRGLSRSLGVPTTWWWFRNAHHAKCHVVCLGLWSALGRQLISWLFWSTDSRGSLPSLLSLSVKWVKHFEEVLSRPDRSRGISRVKVKQPTSGVGWQGGRWNDRCLLQSRLAVNIRCRVVGSVCLDTC